MTEMVMEFINSIGSYGPIMACLFILIESMIPALPLCVFIVINFLSFGNFIGLMISWIFTVIGCLLAFILCRKFLRNIFTKKLRKYEKINDLMKVIDKWKFKDLVLIVAIPFTPAFAINIAASLSQMNIKKFLLALIIGKFFMVYFWGYVGVSFVECLSNPMALIKVVVIVLLAYFVSSVISKKMNID